MFLDRFEKRKQTFELTMYDGLNVLKFRECTTIVIANYDGLYVNGNNEIREKCTFHKT